MTEENLDTTNEEDDDLSEGEAIDEEASSNEEVAEQEKPKRKPRRQLTPEELDRKEFDKCLKHVFDNEGGLANVAGDRGGLTKYGITQRTLSNWLGRPAEDKEVINLKLKTAGDIYHKNYWLKSRAGQLPTALRMTYFDMCVNHGQGNAVKILQRAINRTGRGSIPKVDVDGLIGKNTIKNASGVDIDILRSERMLFFANLVRNKPQQMKFFLGWYRRCINT